jgi:hypothetical protein
VRRDVRGHPEPQTDAFIGSLRLEGVVADGAKQVVLGGHHQVEVLLGGERTFCLDDSRYRHPEELAARRWSEMANHLDGYPGGHQREGCDQHRHGDGQDLVGEVGEMVAEVFPAGIGVDEELGERTVGKLGDGAGSQGEAGTEDGNGILL